LKLKKGETVISYSAGGGGYGNPIERPIERVLKDYKDQIISKIKARRIYKVIINKDGDADYEKTKKLRSL